MSDTLLGDDALGIVRLIDGYAELAGRLRDYPPAAITQIYERHRYVGPRTLMWLLRAISETEFDSFSSQRLPVGQIERICNTALECLRYRTHAKKEPIWRTSALAALTHLQSLSRRLPKASAVRVQKIASSQQRQFRADLRVVLHTMLKPEPRSEDLFLISELLRALYVTDWRRVGPKRITLLSAAQKELEHQLSLHASDSAHYRPVLLARAAVLVDRLVDHDSRVPVTACLEDQMAKASSALLSKTVGATDSQFLLDIPGFGRLFSMAWEETLLLTEIRTVRPPTSVSHFENILNDLWGRIIPSPDGSTALFDHRSEFYPDPAPHFTGYGIVLCMAVSRMLRERLRLLLQGRIESIDPGCAATLGKGLILNSRNMLDTEERTVAYLVRRLRRPKREGIESLKGRNTILLFGPPGTGKTTIIPALTRFLSREYHCRSAPADWRLYVLNPRLFLRHDSYSDMLAEVSNLFSVMLHLDRCVFFLDEAEELVRSRDIEGEKFSRMFTAAMLPFLARLEQTPSVFALATNHIDKMDEAAIRKGRFAVRKGLGFLDRNSVRKLIAGKAGSLPSPLRVRCLELLVRRTVKDILDVLHDVHSVWDSTKDSARTLKALESRKPYVSLVETKQHDNNVKRYDDTCSS